MTRKGDIFLIASQHLVPRRAGVYFYQGFILTRDCMSEGKIISSNRKVYSYEQYLLMVHGIWGSNIFLNCKLFLNFVTCDTWDFHHMHGYVYSFLFYTCISPTFF